MRKLACLISLGLLVLATAPTVKAQDDDTTRKLWDTAFISSGTKRTSPRKSAKRSYRIATPAIRPVNVAGESVIGVTIWRLRHAKATDSGERILEQEGADATTWIPERVSLDSKLAEGDRVRLSIEAARSGYLYVIDREQYADGTFSDPYLIFPTKRTLGGKNEVRAGKIIEIPAQDDSPPFFTLKRSSSKQISEVLSILVTPTPIEGLEIGDTHMKLSNEQVAKWESSWGNNVGRLELENSAHRTWTKVEKEAGSGGTQTLTNDAPAPQSLFFRPQAKLSDPLIVKVELRYGIAGGAKSRRTSRF